VIGAETAYARKLGVKLKQPATDNLTAIQELREAIAAVLGCPIGRLTRGAQRLDHALRGSPDGLARPRACLGDAGPGGKPGGAARTSQPGLVGETRRQCGRDAVWAASLKAAAATSGSNAATRYASLLLSSAARTRDTVSIIQRETIASTPRQAPARRASPDDHPDRHRLGWDESNPATMARVQLGVDSPAPGGRRTAGSTVAQAWRVLDFVAR
jgi:hypothetical protein